MSRSSLNPVAGVLLVIFAVGCGSLVRGASPPCAPVPTGPIASGQPRHTADDVLATDSEKISATGRFANADGRICAYVKTDGVGWVLRGEGWSDGRGWVSVSLSPIPKPGDYPIRLEMPQDGTGAEATIFVRSRGTHIAVFDIDGTLTRGEIWPVFLKGHLAEPRPFGLELAQALRERGCLIVYLTARAYELTESTRMWREYWHFPQGVVHVSRSPLGLSGDKAADFKRSFLEEARGPREAGLAHFIADFAFGNRPSDLSAYLAVYPNARIYLMDYVARNDEEKQSEDYRVVHHTWKKVADELRTPESGPRARACN